jgi:hypothetical protein
MRRLALAWVVLSALPFAACSDGDSTANVTKAGADAGGVLCCKTAN